MAFNSRQAIISCKLVHPSLGRDGPTNTSASTQPSPTQPQRQKIISPRSYAHHLAETVRSYRLVYGCLGKYGHPYCPRQTNTQRAQTHFCGCYCIIKK